MIYSTTNYLQGIFNWPVPSMDLHNWEESKATSHNGLWGASPWSVSNVGGCRLELGLVSSFTKSVSSGYSLTTGLVLILTSELLDIHGRDHSIISFSILYARKVRTIGPSSGTNTMSPTCVAIFPFLVIRWWWCSLECYEVIIAPLLSQIARKLGYVLKALVDSGVIKPHNIIKIIWRDVLLGKTPNQSAIYQLRRSYR